MGSTVIERPTRLQQSLAQRNDTLTGERPCNLDDWTSRSIDSGTK